MRIQLLWVVSRVIPYGVAFGLEFQTAISVVISFSLLSLFFLFEATKLLDNFVINLMVVEYSTGDITVMPVVSATSSAMTVVPSSTSSARLPMPSVSAVVRQHHTLSGQQLAAISRSQLMPFLFGVSCLL